MGDCATMRRGIEKPDMGCAAVHNPLFTIRGTTSLFCAGGADACDQGKPKRFNRGGDYR
jgi:hypothetical protein